MGLDISESSDIIKSVTTLQLKNAEKAQALEFHDGKCLILSSSAIAFHKSLASFEDPLSDSCLGYAELAHEHHLNWVDEILVEEYASGYIGLKDQRVILITPNAIQLFPGKNQALRNQQHVAQILLN